MEVRRISAAPTVRRAVEQRSRGACERCGLEWPWALRFFRVSEDGPDRADNLVALCLRCSDGQPGPSTPMIGERTDRVKLRDANNARAGVAPLTDSRRRALIAARGGCCEVCGSSGGERPLEVHHRIAVLDGGHDGQENLQVLCFACHRDLRPCITGCGAWTRRRTGLCQYCLTRKLLEDLIPQATWEDIKRRFPGFVRQWKPGYEPRRLT